MDGRQPPAVPGPGSTDILMRRIAAVGLGIFLFSTASSFSPVSWLTQPDWTTYLDGPWLIDRVLSPVLRVGAAILHWYIASQREPLALTVSIPTGPDVQVVNGQAQVLNRDIVLGLWLPSYYWAFAAAEAALLYAIGSESVSTTASRIGLTAIILTVWILGWNALPWYRKEQAWALIKEYVLRLVIMEMVNMAFGGGGSGARRRRRRL